MSEIVPELVFLGIPRLVIAMAAAVSNARAEVLSEAVARHVQQQVLNVTTSVPLRSFDDPEFHDHVRRSVESSSYRPWQLVNGLIEIVGATAGLISLMVVLLALQPLIAVVGLLSMCRCGSSLAAIRATCSPTEVALTSLDRERWYLIELMTGRVAAAELRALDAEPFFTHRYDQVSVEVLRRLRQVASVRLRRSLKATSGSVVIVFAHDAPRDQHGLRQRAVGRQRGHCRTRSPAARSAAPRDERRCRACLRMFLVS